MSGMNNDLAIQLSNLWLAADVNINNANQRDAIWTTQDDWFSLTDKALKAQQTATNERNAINTIGSVAGCIGGAILGFMSGGPLGAAAGCSAGSKALSTVTDWAQDSALFGDTKAEEEIKALEQELKDFEIDITTDETMKYDALDMKEKEREFKRQQDDVLSDYSNWLWNDFYAKSDLDYVLDLGIQATEFALSKKGGEMIEESWASWDADDSFGLEDAIKNIESSAEVDVESLGDMSLDDYQQIVRDASIDQLNTVDKLRAWLRGI
tara:strand:+ start:1335 stop:2135 length:801 start_codon:yes stop_codon:yes gene_type:complete